ncbi:MAG: hypothetical protein GY929_08645 [Actinomycetia bacterium]|nr:hypothetical protein [Actinomycetes bacterium]
MKPPPSGGTVSTRTGAASRSGSRVAEVHGELVTGPTKAGERRSVTLPGFLVDELAAHWEDAGGREALVFTTPDGTPIWHSNIRRRIWKPALVAASLDPDTRWHDLRHSHVTDLIARATTLY